MVQLVNCEVLRSSGDEIMIYAEISLEKYTGMVKNALSCHCDIEVSPEQLVVLAPFIKESQVLEQSPVIFAKNIQDDWKTIFSDRIQSVM